LYDEFDFTTDFLHETLLLENIIEYVFETLRLAVLEALDLVDDFLTHILLLNIILYFAIVANILIDDFLELRDVLQLYNSLVDIKLDFFKGFLLIV
jgi:hypothetical protein